MDAKLKANFGMIAEQPNVVRHEIGAVKTQLEQLGIIATDQQIAAQIQHEIKVQQAINDADATTREIERSKQTAKPAADNDDSAFAFCHGCQLDSGSEMLSDKLSGRTA